MGEHEALTVVVVVLSRDGIPESGGWRPHSNALGGDATSNSRISGYGELSKRTTEQS